MQKCFFAHVCCTSANSDLNFCKILFIRGSNFYLIVALNVICVLRSTSTAPPLVAIVAEADLLVVIIRLIDVIVDGLAPDLSHVHARLHRTSPKNQVDEMTNLGNQNQVKMTLKYKKQTPCVQNLD